MTRYSKTLMASPPFRCKRDVVLYWTLSKLISSLYYFVSLTFTLIDQEVVEAHCVVGCSSPPAVHAVHPVICDAVKAVQNFEHNLVINLIRVSNLHFSGTRRRRTSTPSRRCTAFPTGFSSATSGRTTASAAGNTLETVYNVAICLRGYLPYKHIYLISDKKVL